MPPKWWSRASLHISGYADHPSRPHSVQSDVRRRYARPMNDEESSSPNPSPQQRVIEAASATLRGELGVIEGSRLLCTLRFRVSSLDHDPDFLPFFAIDSETD